MHHVTKRPAVNDQLKMTFEKQLLNGNSSHDSAVLKVGYIDGAGTAILRVRWVTRCCSVLNVD
jgi:hypothetical protein